MSSVAISFCRQVRGAFVRSFLSSGSPFVFSADGRRLFTLTDRDVHVSSTESGDWQSSFRHSLPWPGCIAMSVSGNVLLTDTDLHCVAVFRPDGTEERRWGSSGLAAGQFLHGPASICVTTTDLVFVGDQCRVQVFQLSDGSFVRQFGGNGQYISPSSLELSRNERELFVFNRTAPGDQLRVSVWSTDGQFVREWEADCTGRTGKHYRRTVVSLANEVLVSDGDGHRVLCFDAQGVLLRSWVLPGTGAGQPNDHVQGLTVSPTSGELFVTHCVLDDEEDPDGVRVQVFWWG